LNKVITEWLAAFERQVLRRIFGGGGGGGKESEKGGRGDNKK